MLSTGIRVLLGLGLAASMALPGSVAQARSKYGLKRASIQKPPATAVYPGLQSNSLTVKFRDDLGIQARDGGLYHPDGRAVASVQGLIDAGLVIHAESEFDYDKSVLLDWRRRGEARAGAALPDLSSYFRLRLRAGTPVASAARLCDLLNRSFDVELAFLEGRPEVAVDLSPSTPDFQPQQSYLAAAPGGVDAYAAWGYAGGNGTGVTICDIEYGWQTDHEDLSRLDGRIIGGDAGPDAHGTAVMGQMLADSTLSALTGIGYGVTGISYGADGMMISVASRSTADALMLAAEHLTVGDVVLIELHQPGPNSTGVGQVGFVPMEWTPSVFDAILTLTANGFIVCEAAGNGGENLNATVYGGWFDTTVQHSGAIMCGAGAPPSGLHGPDRSRLSFSNYGMRVDLQGHGRGVVTTGYGDLFDPADPRQEYTSQFAGTSSASPIVTASVACVQGRFKNVSGGYTMTAREIRNLLYATGSPQTGNTSEHIGPRPDLGSAVALVTDLSAYAAPRTLSADMFTAEVRLDTLWLINPHASPATFAATIVDSLPAAPSPTAATEDVKAFLREDAPRVAHATGDPWLLLNPSFGTVPAYDSLPLSVTMDGTAIDGSYFGTYYRARIDLQLDGAAGAGSLSVPVMALVQNTLHGDTIQIMTPTVTHRATSETSISGWDYTDGTAMGWLYDGSFLVGRRVGSDTTVYRDVFNERMWRGRDYWQVDSSWLPGYLIWRDSSITEDSLMGLRYEAWVPQDGDSAEFVYWRAGLYGRGATFTQIAFGVVGDWDLPSVAGANNFGAFDEARQMVYQTGGNGYENDAAGFALLRSQARGGVAGSNVVDVYPSGGFTDGHLYTQMATAGFRIDASNVDLHTILSPYVGTVPADEAVEFELVVLSSRTGLAGLEAAYARAQALSDSLRYLSCPITLGGDVNGDATLSASDIIYLVNFVYKGGAEPLPIRLSGNINCDEDITSSDIIHLVNHLFKSGPAPCDACVLY